MSHTPTPWEALADPCHFDTRSDIYAEGKLIAQTCTGYPELEANAAFIVKACNAHDELVAAIKALRAAALEEKPYSKAVHMASALDISYHALAKVGAL